MKAIETILLDVWGYSNFRVPQREIIENVLSNNDTLALLPTGGGKSICFQVPTLASEGMCLVVSPLIALMKDQVENLLKRNIAAASVNSSMHFKQVDNVLNNAMQGMYKFLYISPERIQTDIFLARVKKMNITIIAIDEAHCISQWGYDFRPSYLHIAQLRELLPNIPIIALTATATKDVIEDIQTKLHFKNAAVYKKSFNRSNLSYVVYEVENKLGKLLDILRKVEGTGIVYVRNRKRTKEIAEFLYKNDISADFYHAGLNNEDRDRKQQNWINNKTRIIVCTNAFGMGIDKPDVRIVIHMDIPPDIESYYQEAGRAGRDEKKSYAVLLYHSVDTIQALQQIEENQVSIDEIRNYYEFLCQYFHLAVGSGLNEQFEFVIEDFCQKYALKAHKVITVLKILEQQEVLIATEAIYQTSKIMITTSNEEIYKLQISHKQYEPLLKLLLRSYGGLFDNFVNIKESFIANKLKTTVDQIKKALVLLQTHQYITYIPENNAPKIIFLQARHSKSNLLLDHDFILKRFKLKTKKQKDMLHYVTTQHLCRTKIICSYFDDLLTEDCGVCDVCIKKKKNGLTSNLYENISQQILEQLSLKPKNIPDLVASITPYKENDILLSIQWLLETRIIIQNEIGKFELVKN